MFMFDVVVGGEPRSQLGASAAARHSSTIISTILALFSCWVGGPEDFGTRRQALHYTLHYSNKNIRQEHNKNDQNLRLFYYYYTKNIEYSTVV
jgi:hypothetical protein